MFAGSNQWREFSILVNIQVKSAETKRQLNYLFIFWLLASECSTFRILFAFYCKAFTFYFGDAVWKKALRSTPTNRHHVHWIKCFMTFLRDTTQLIFDWNSSVVLNHKIQTVPKETIHPIEQSNPLCSRTLSR